MNLSIRWSVFGVGLLCTAGIIDAFNRNRQSVSNPHDPPSTGSLLATEIFSANDENRKDSAWTKRTISVYPNDIGQFLVYISPYNPPGAPVYSPLVSASHVSPPIDYFPAGFPPFFIGGPVLYLPLPFCFPAFPYVPPTPEDTNETGTTAPETDDAGVVVDSRYDGPEVNYTVYYNTKTGVSLDTVKPLRPPTVVNPPFDHSNPRRKNNDQRPTTPEDQLKKVPTQVTDLPSVAVAGAIDTQSTSSLEDAIKECCQPSAPPNCFSKKDFYFVDGDPCDLQNV